MLWKSFELLFFAFFIIKFENIIKEIIYFFLLDIFIMYDIMYF